MRMRVTKPDFWESEEIGNLSVFGRLLLKAVWSYVDDNGVQRDSQVGIAGECFRYDLARDPVATLELIADGLDELWKAGHIVRYTAGGSRYIEVVDWMFWQKPQRPSKARYPTTLSEDVVITPIPPDTLRTPSGEAPRNPLPEPEPETESDSESETHTSHLEEGVVGGGENFKDGDQSADPPCEDKCGRVSLPQKAVCQQCLDHRARQVARVKK